MSSQTKLLYTEEKSRADIPNCSLDVSQVEVYSVRRSMKSNESRYGVSRGDVCASRQKEEGRPK